MRTPSRRGILGTFAAIGTTAAILDRGAAATPSAHPDAAILRLCEEFLALERQADRSFDTIADDDERSDYLTPIYARQNQISLEIEGIGPTTLAGFAAIAFAAVRWATDLIDEDETETHRILLRGLLKGLIGGVA